MFGAGGWGGFGASEGHISKERDAIPRPIPLEFPTFTPSYTHNSLTSRLSIRVRNKICHTRSFTNITDTDLEALNVKFTPNQDLASFVPENEFKSRPYLYDDDLESMLDEISVDNEDAFREVLRLPPLSGRKKPRLAYARNFFGSLEDMARYWDNEKDEYYTVPVDGSQPKSSLQEDTAVKGVREAPPAQPASSQPSNVEMKDVTDPDGSVETKEVYKGYRLSNAESMNPGTRIAMTKNLLKMVMHKFHCRDHEPMPSPREKLMIRGVKIQSIQYHFCVAKIPSDIKQARARMVEGPIMAVHCREEIRFKNRDGLSADKTAFTGEHFDFLREVGCMLILATQRARSDTNATQQSPGGRDKWWVTKERWGGGPNHWGQLASEVYEEDDPSWSPEERKLQEDKRRKEEEEIKEKGLDAKKQALDAGTIQVDDLLATSSTKQISSASAAPSRSPIGGPMPLVVPSSTPMVPDVTSPRKKKLRGMHPASMPGDTEPAMRDGKRLMHVPAYRKRWYNEWQKLRPNTPHQDDKIKSRHIGRDDKLGGFDEIFMMSSVNHHVAISKMRVHPDYLAWLDHGEQVPDEDEHTTDELKRNVLYVDRSEWYDMFDVQKRKEFLTALWRIMSWTNRDEVPRAEYERMEQKRTAMESDITTAQAQQDRTEGGTSTS